MNVGQGQAHDLRFGPPSESVNISDYIQSAVTLEEESACNVFATTSACAPGISRESWSQLSEDERLAIAAECSVNDLRDSLTNVLSNPRLMAYVTKVHDASVQTIYETADPSNRRKRKRATVTEPAQEHVEVTALRTKLDGVQLKSWPLTVNAAPFIRPTKQSDYNTIMHTKQFSLGSLAADTREALVFVKVYSRLLWGHRLVARSSEHVLLSSQTLGDLFDVIPCSSSQIPKERASGDGEMTECDAAVAEGSTGCVVCIEDVAYGDGQTEEDYSDKLLRMVNVAQEDTAEVPRLKNGPSLYDTPFSTLTLRLHEPYWLLHAGNCEHFLVVDQIRLHHPSDPTPATFPLTTQITPPLLDVCRACNKAPAVYAISGDMRLGESPFVICAPCWRWMEGPKGTEGVVVVPLPKHEHAWGG